MLNVNDAGLIVGTEFVNGLQGEQAVAIVPGQTPTLLGPNPPGYPLCFPYGLNQGGEAAGYCSVSNSTSDYQAMLFQNGTSTPLAALPGDAWDVAWSLNVRGQAVGESFSSTQGSRAVLFDGAQTIELATRVPYIGTWRLASAVHINDNGQILGLGSPSCTASSCSTHAFLLTPSCDGQ